MYQSIPIEQCEQRYSTLKSGRSSVLLWCYLYIYLCVCVFVHVKHHWMNSVILLAGKFDLAYMGLGSCCYPFLSTTSTCLSLSLSLSLSFHRVLEIDVQEQMGSARLWCVRQSISYRLHFSSERSHIFLASSSPLCLFTSPLSLSLGRNMTTSSVNY